MILQNTIDASTERAILTGMIMSKSFTARIMKSFSPNFMKVKFTKKISTWLKEYWDKYNDVPGACVTELVKFNSTDLEEEQKELIEKLIEQIVENEGSSFNVEYWLEKAEVYFQKQLYNDLKNELSSALIDDNIEAAKNAVDDFKAVSFSGASGFFLTRDFNMLKQILTEESDELFELPGPLGKLLGPFARGDLIAVCAPGKRGKTWWLIEMAVQAWIRKLKVLFVSLEMTSKQVIYRFGQNLTGESRREKKILLPSFSDDEDIVTFEEKEKSGVSYQKMVKRLERIRTQVGSSELHVISYPAYSATANQIIQYIEHLEVVENFLPDVVLIDYADIVASDKKIKDHRHEINNIWMSLRSMAQKKNNLVVTATHSNKMTFDRDIKQGDASEDIRKINHVALMFAINQKAEEREHKLARIKVLASRHDEMSTDEVVILTGYDIGKAWIGQRWLRNIEGYDRRFNKNKIGKNSIKKH